MKRMFMEKFFPTSRTATIRKEICGIRQHSRETLHEYEERFNKLCATCPHHQISDQLLIQYFYEGLVMSHKMHISSGPKKSAIEQLMNLKDDSKLSPPLEAQAESLSARLKTRPIQPKAQSGSLAQVALHVSNTEPPQRQLKRHIST
ncbi:hypothetical protein CR513_55882, partial [Mucuna pruriens]